MGMAPAIVIATAKRRRMLVPVPVPVLALVPVGLVGTALGAIRGVARRLLATFRAAHARHSIRTRPCCHCGASLPSPVACLAWSQAMLVAVRWRASF